MLAGVLWRAWCAWYPGIWAAFPNLCWLRRRCWRRVVCALSSRGCEIYGQNIRRGRSRAWVSAPPVVVYSALAPVVDLRALLRFSLVSFHAWALSTLSGDSVASASVAKSYIFLSLFPPQTPPIALSIRRSINQLVISSYIIFTSTVRLIFYYIIFYRAYTRTRARGIAKG